MTVTDASYSRDDDSDGFARPSPPIRTGSASKLRSSVETWWSVDDRKMGVLAHPPQITKNLNK